MLTMIGYSCLMFLNFSECGDLGGLYESADCNGGLDMHTRQVYSTLET
jgi:hypothetical protein